MSPNSLNTDFMTISPDYPETEFMTISPETDLLTVIVISRLPPEQE